MDAKEAISVTDVSKTYRLRTRGIPTLKGTVLDVILGRHRRRQFQALDGLSFSVAPGETVGVIGANGAGKSTLLGVLAGTIFPSGGEVKIDGRVSPLLELGAGFHQDLTGRENVFLNGSVLGLKRKQIAAAFDRIVDFAGLHGFMDTPVKFYSSGMYVRLGFSVAVEVDPDVLLVDEVLAVGDEAFQLKCYARMEEFQAKGKTILIVSHDLDAIQRLCSRVILLQDGKAAAEGKPDEVIPAYRRAAAEAARPTKSEETGSREIAYTAVRFLDAGGREKDEFFSGEKLVIELDYEAREKTADPVFGFAVRDAEGRLLFGTNTSLEKVATGEVSGPGRVRLEIEPLPLLTGEYLFSFAIHSPDHWRQYHRLENAKRVRVANPEATEGLYRLPCRFTIGPKGE